MDFFEAIREATTARLIDWRQAGEPTVTDEYSGEPAPEYRAVVGDMTVALYVVEAQVKGFLGTTSKRRGYVMEIHRASDHSHQIFTSDPRLIPGRQVGDMEPMVTYWRVRHEMTSQDLGSALHQKLAHALHTS